MTAVTREQKLFDEAFICLQWGHFQGAIDRCTRLERLRGRKHVKVAHIAWLARACLPECKVSASRLRDARETTLRHQGGQGLPELAMLHLRSGDGDRGLQLLDATLATARAQHGVLVAFHPTALLELAAYSSAKLGDSRRAIELANLALGHGGAYAALHDVVRLAEILGATDAPLALWADWCGIFVTHVQLATARGHFLAELNDEKALSWARREDAQSELVLTRVFETGPPGLRDLLAMIASHLAATPLAEVLRKKFADSGPIAACPAAPDARWWQPDCLRFRYCWHDLISEEERTMLLNGDWAMFNTPTVDFSMALAQWWRVLESILKRCVARELSQLFQQHPEWVMWDRENLSEAQQRKEEIFIKKLADPRKAEQTTLGDLILILKKCVPEGAAAKPNGSRLRMEARRHLGTFTKQLRPLVEEAWLNPVHLTEDNISWFRNRASHDAAMTSCDAFVGRAVARRVLDRFFTPVLCQRGFIARI